MNYNDFPYFSAIAEEKSFTAAEKKLGISKSTLSRKLSALEEYLGVCLIHRNSRHLSLTTAGKALHKHCKEMECYFAETVASVRMMGKDTKGLVRLCCQTSLAQFYISKVIAKYMNVYPEASVELCITENWVHPIKAESDLFITVQPFESIPSDMIAKKIVNDVYILTASPEFITRHGMPKKPEDIKSFKTIGEGPNITKKKQCWELSSKNNYAVFIEHTPCFTCKNLYAQYQAAIHSAGIALLPSAFLAEALSKKWLVQVLPEWTAHTETVYAVFPSQKNMLPSLRTLLDYINENLPLTMGL